MVTRLNFYDVKAKKSFNSESYTMKTRMVKGRKKRYAVVAKSPLTGNVVWRVVANDFKR